MDATEIDSYGWDFDVVEDYEPSPYNGDYSEGGDESPYDDEPDDESGDESDEPTGYAGMEDRYLDSYWEDRYEMSFGGDF